MLELTKEVMGALALAVFWIHVLLVAGAAGLDLRDLLRLRRWLRPVTELREGAVGSLEASVVAGEGPGDQLARNVVAQVGRSKGDGKVHFSDADHRSECYGGRLRLVGGETLELGPGPAAVWPRSEEREAAAAPRSPEQILEVQPQAKRGKGWQREVEVGIEPGSTVWVAGRLGRAPEGDAWVLEAEDPEQSPGLLIAAMSPRAWITGRCWLIVAFIVADLLVAAGCTAAALWPPLWDLVSMLGAAAALGFFLGVQPLGVSLNEGVRTPDRAYLRGRWVV